MTYLVSVVMTVYCSLLNRIGRKTIISLNYIGLALGQELVYETGAGIISG